MIVGEGLTKGFSRGEARNPQLYRTDVVLPLSPRRLSEMHPEGQTQIALAEVQESALWVRHFH